MVNAWSTRFLLEVQKFVPIRVIRFDPSSKPWYSGYLRYLASWRDCLFHRPRDKSGSCAIMTAYRKVRNLFIAELRAAEKKYFSSIWNSLLSRDLSPTRWWNLAKRACGWSNQSQMSPLLSGTKLITSPLGKAELLNNHFQSQCSAFPTAQSVPQASNLGHGFHHSDSITPAHVQQILSKLPSGKSPGADRITNEILKATAVSIADPLSRIFNNSLSSGIFPDVWKLATISPIHKSGKDQTQPVSYRPIALLSSVSKVLERVVHELLLQYCLNNKVIPDEQFGFIPGRSAEWQLLTTLENWQVENITMFTRFFLTQQKPSIEWIIKFC